MFVVKDFPVKWKPLQSVNMFKKCAIKSEICESKTYTNGVYIYNFKLLAPQN